MKKALIITYYWPPSGGSGVQRWLKFVKYLRDFGWEPIVYTPENPENPEVDNSLLKDIPQNIIILKYPIWEPYNFYKKFTGKRKSQQINTGFLSENKKPKLLEGIAIWIRGNFFIPDARKYWIKPSVKFLENYLIKNHVDVIISTGPPHSMHLIAYHLKKKLNINWIADFRDPWTNIDFYDQLKLSSRADKKHHKLEHTVLSSADKVIVISNTMAEDMKRLHNRHYEVITNGYDTEDLQATTVKADTKFSIAHIGTMPKTRNPEALWKVLNNLTKEDSQFAYDLEIKLVGKVDYSVTQMLEHYNLSKYLNKINYLPHDQVINIQQQSQILLLLLNDTPNAKMILTGKFFEYMSAQRPILCIGPTDGDAAEILKKTKSGYISGFKDEETLKNNILELYSKYKKGCLLSESIGIERYSRKNLTGELVKCMEQL
ncbi:MAG: glycosyltransferase family 4 protein [Bacteroidetes bacterium]|nr:glycosyltransferase family 4 protein [Bacteroidota bacterium]